MDLSQGFVSTVVHDGSSTEIKSMKVQRGSSEGVASSESVASSDSLDLGLSDSAASIIR